MKCSTLLLVLALAALGGRHALAQSPQSLRGLANYTFEPGYKFVANQYKTDANTVAEVIPQPAEGTEIYTFRNGTFVTNTFGSGVWKNPNQRLVLGEGVIVLNPTTRRFAGSVNGEIPQGNLSNRLPVVGRVFSVS
ncbi:MAG: hypothetical protein FJ403_20320 [Verrucomicrobia bacterium]|nr:hypothetical protein [Verrucomicrobiota bacterium]